MKCGRKKGCIAWNKGLKRTWESPTQFKKGYTPWNKGKQHLLITGNKNPRWIEDRTKLQKYGETNKDRRSSAYRDWRINIFKRDNYKCKIDNCDCDGKIVAHHILSYTKFPELRYEINNGITLCKFHHPLKRTEEINFVSLFRGLVDGCMIVTDKQE